MKRIRISQLRQDLFRIADEVTERKEPIVLLRRGKKDLVLVAQEDWTCVKEKAAKYEAEMAKTRKRSMVGSLVLKTDDLEGEIRKIRDEFARSLSKASLKSR